METPEKIIGEYGFLLPRRERASSADGAVAAAYRVGFPVALKIVSADIIHKTDVGGVRLGLASQEEVRAAYREIMDDVRRGAPQARVVGVDVEEMVTGGTELFIGLQWNPQFGPVIAFGLGGVFTELLEDVTFRLLPITSRDAAEMLTEIRGRRVFEGYRGREPILHQVVVDLLLNASRLGVDLADQLGSIDLNPIAVMGEDHRVLDAKILLEQQPRGIQPTARPDTRHLVSFFDAESVAVVGASATPGKIGHAILKSLLAGGYRGRVYAVNSRKTEILGVTSYPSLSTIPASVDLAVAAIALQAVPDLVRECASKGTHSLVIVSGGGRELGTEGERLEAQIASLAREGNVRIVGPNCIGILNGANRLDTFFQEPDRMVRPPLGPLAVLTQSGTVGVTVLEKVANLGVSRFVSYGNRLDVDEADLLAYLGADPQTKVIACYLEGLADGRKFIRSAAEVTPKKPVVVFKSGRTPEGAKGAVSHTGFFGGTYGAWRGAFAQARITAVDNTEQLIAAAKALSWQPRAKGPHVAFVSNGAGPIIQALDLLTSRQLEVASVSERTLAQMGVMFPPYCVLGNPLDVTGSADSRDYDTGLSLLLADPGVDLAMVWFVFQDTPLDEGIVEALASLRVRFSEKPIVCGAAGGPYTGALSHRIEECGVPVYATVSEWVAAASALVVRV